MSFMTCASCVSAASVRARLSFPEAIVVIVVVVIASAFVAFGRMSVGDVLQLVAGTGLLAALVVSVVNGAPARVARAVLQAASGPAPAL
ncbi:hypothetical protein ACFT8P_26575 [Streptomyces sp. NPDC057101]|uniref:hypothetical protein n=1 Tax=Streptomyces sp. NPDC057101 TaxID=3346020 RepID=UPI0036364A3E